MAKPIDIKSQVKAATHKAATPESKKAAERLGKAARQKRNAKLDAEASTASNKLERVARKKAPASEQKIDRAMKRINKQSLTLETGKHLPSSAEKREAKRGVIKGSSGGVKPKTAGAAPRTATGDAPKRPKAGRPKLASTVERERAMANHRAKRAAEGKSSRGRKANPNSVRSLRAKKTQERTTRAAAPLSKRSSSIKRAGGSPTLKPSDVAAKYKNMTREPMSASSGDEERGLHKRGNSVVTYANGGKTKFVRRNFEFKHPKGKSSVSVTQRYRAGESGDWQHRTSAREVHSPDKKVAELVTSHPSGKRALETRVRNVQVKTPKGKVVDYTEVGRGRPVSKAVKGKRGAVKKAARSLKMAPLGRVADSIHERGVDALHSTMELSRDSTRHKGSDYRPSREEGEPEKVRVKHEVSRPKGTGLPGHRVKTLKRGK